MTRTLSELIQTIWSMTIDEQLTPPPYYNPPWHEDYEEYRREVAGTSYDYEYFNDRPS